MIPTYDPNHVKEGLALLTDLFKPAANVNAVLKALLTECQGFEDQILPTINGRLLANAVGDALDKIGDIVGVLRYGRSDADYRVALSIQLIVNLSSGTVEDLLSIGVLAFGLGNFSYLDSTTESGVWQLTAIDQYGFPYIAAQISQARAAGTRGVIVHSEPSSGPHFTFGSTYGGPAGLGSGTVYAPSFISTDTDATGV